MNYAQKPKYHFKPKTGWINDPNGLVWFRGYYHVFYQHAPHFEIPRQEPICWGHARTKDFLIWEELPIALYPDRPYDCGGCWSGTATVKDDTLFLIYSSIMPDQEGNPCQTVSVAYSKDGITFEKHPNNPVIDTYPKDGSPDFRDPAILKTEDAFYCVMASGFEKRLARLLLYRSHDLVQWQYQGILAEWENAKYAECPSFIKIEQRFLLSASIWKSHAEHRFSLMFGDFKDGTFLPQTIASVDRGPDQYAGQIFKDDKGRTILIAWIPGWHYAGFAETDIGCLSIPREITEKDGKIYAYPIAELRHLLQDSDPAVKMTENGCIITGRDKNNPILHEGKIHNIKILRDAYILECFINDGEAAYTVIL